MTLYEFILLDELERANAVWDGVFISQRSTKRRRILLYNLGEFFVEVFYNVAANKIEKLRPFKTKRLLEPYIKDISIQRLY